MINETDFAENGFEAVWRLMSCVVTLVDPDANKESIAAAIRLGLLSKYGQIGGKRSGEARVVKAEKGWMVHALELAKHYRAVESSISQDNLATEIISSWKDNNNICVGHTRLKQVISIWEKEGKIPRRKPKIN